MIIEFLLAKSFKWRGFTIYVTNYNVFQQNTFTTFKLIKASSLP